MPAPVAGIDVSGVDVTIAALAALVAATGPAMTVEIKPAWLAAAATGLPLQAEGRLLHLIRIARKRLQSITRPESNEDRQDYAAKSRIWNANLVQSDRKAL